MERAVLEGEFSQRKADGVKAIKVQMKETLWLCVDKRAISESDMRSQTLRHSYFRSEEQTMCSFGNTAWSFNAPSQTHLIKFLFNSTKCWKVCRVKSSHGIAAKISSGNKRRSRAFYQTLSGSDQNCWFNLIFCCCKFTFLKCTLSTSTFRPQIVLSGRLFARGSLARKTLKIVFSSSTPEHSSSDAQLFTFLVFRSARTSENTSGFRFYLFIHFFFSDYILVFYPPYLSQLSWPKSVTRVSHISSATLS